jgi:hypothetical protein
MNHSTSAVFLLNFPGQLGQVRSLESSNSIGSTPGFAPTVDIGASGHAQGTHVLFLGEGVDLRLQHPEV